MAQTFHALFNGIAFVAAKPMACLTNTSATEIIKIRRIILNNAQTVAVTGVATFLELRKYGPVATINTPVAGLLVSHDSTNTSPAALALQSGASITGGTLVGGAIRRIFWSSDEPAISTMTSDELQCFIPNNIIYDWIPHTDIQPITLRNAEQLMLFNTTGAAGIVDIYVEFTKE
jgi:hypothetical protein